MNTYAVGAAAMAAAIAVLVVALVFGLASPSRPTVVTPARPGSVPASWQSVTFGGLTMYAPGNWRVYSETTWDSCELGWFKANGIVLNSGGSFAPPIGCPATLPPTQLSGLFIDPGPNGPVSGVYGPCLHINGLSVCPAEAADNPTRGALLDLAVRIPGRSQLVAVDIGLAGGGKVAHTILYSMRASAPKAKVTPTTPTTKTTPTTIKPSSTRWPERVIATTGVAQGLTPTSGGIYWLSVTGPEGPPQRIAPVRYDPTTSQLTKGPAITGFVGSPALEVAGGWVWMAVAVGNRLVVEQFSPSTLSLHMHWSYAVPDNISSSSMYPNLAATVAGPLWVACGEDLWALNPATGTVENQFDTHVEVSSMSIDPTGSLLYAGGSDSKSPLVVTEYDARTGRELAQVQPESVGGVSVSATNGGVWVAYRTGNEGRVDKLTADGLRESGLTFDAGGASYSGVSQGTLWLAVIHSTSTLTCIDSTTGVVLSTEPTTDLTGDPVARGDVLYAFSDSGVVAVTPPRACFG